MPRYKHTREHMQLETEQFDLFENLFYISKKVQSIILIYNDFLLLSTLILQGQDSQSFYMQLYKFCVVLCPRILRFLRLNIAFEADIIKA